MHFTMRACTLHKSLCVRTYRPLSMHAHTVLTNTLSCLAPPPPPPPQLKLAADMYVHVGSLFTPPFPIHPYLCVLLSPVLLHSFLSLSSVFSALLSAILSPFFSPSSPIFLSLPPFLHPSLPPSLCPLPPSSLHPLSHPPSLPPLHTNSLPPSILPPLPLPLPPSPKLQQARNIRNHPIINRDPQSARLHEMEGEIRALREELLQAQSSKPQTGRSVSTADTSVMVGVSD